MHRSPKNPIILYCVGLELGCWPFRFENINANTATYMYCKRMHAVSPRSYSLHQ